MRDALEGTQGHRAAPWLAAVVAVLGLAAPAVAHVVVGPLPPSVVVAPPPIVVAPPPPIVVALPPPLVVVPAVPSVLYAPALGTDVFVYGGRWYYPYHGHWFVGRSAPGSLGPGRLRPHAPARRRRAGALLPGPAGPLEARRAPGPSRPPGPGQGEAPLTPCR